MPHEDHFIPVAEGISLHTSITTPSTATSHPTLLFLHFWGGTNRTWQPVKQHLQDQYTTITPTLRGWGASTLQADASAYRITDHVADILALIKHLETNDPHLLSHGLVLIGHSMGGKIAQALAPQLSPALLKGTVLIAPAPTGSFALPDEMREQQIHAYDSYDAARFVMQNVLSAAPGAIADRTLDDLARDAEGGAAEAKRAWPAYGMAEDLEEVVVRGVAERSRSGRRLRFLVVAGEVDRVETVPNVTARVADVLSSAGAEVDTVVLAGRGHLLPVESPGEVADAIVRFADMC